MKRIQVLLLCLLVSGGRLYAALPGNTSAATQPSAEEPQTPLPPSTTVDRTALQDSYQAATDSATISVNKEFYSLILRNLAYENADVELDQERCTTQEGVDSLKNALDLALNQTPFQYVLAHLPGWTAEFYGTRTTASDPIRYDELVAESDFTFLKNETDSIIGLFGRDDVDQDFPTWIYGKPDVLDPDKSTPDNPVYTPTYLGLIRHTRESRQNASTLFNNRKESLARLIAQIDADATTYATLLTKETYTTPKGWGSSYTPAEHTLVDLSLYNQYLQDEISIVDMLAIYQQSISDAYAQATPYFKESDRTGTLYTELMSPIETFKTRLDAFTANVKTSRYTYGGTVYTELSNLWEAINTDQSNTQTIGSTLAGKLTELVGDSNTKLTEARKVYSCLTPTGTEAQALNTAITGLEAVIAANQKYISDYTDAHSLIDAAIGNAQTYFAGLQTTLRGQTETARTANTEWNNALLANAIAEADNLLAQAATYAATESQLADTQESLTRIYNETASLIAKAQGLQNCIDLYGDEDNALAALKEEIAVMLTRSNRTPEEVGKLTDRADEQMTTLESEYQSAKTALTNKINASQEFYNKWKDSKEGIEALKTAIQEAQTVLETYATETVRNTRRLAEATKELDAVYESLGGYSDPYESHLRLVGLIENAEILYAKYGYADLLIALNEAKANVNSGTKHILDQHCTNLEQAMAVTTTQYALAVGTLDTQLADTKAKMTERYADDVPALSVALMAEVEQAMATVDGSTDRVCTNIPKIQHYTLQLNQMAAEADKTWETAVEDFYNDILEAELKFNSYYSDKQELGEAIATAKQQYEQINTQYKTIASVVRLAEDLDVALAAVEGVDRLNISNQFVILYASIRDLYALYGSDENTVGGSGSKAFLANRQALYDELKDINPADIHYSLTELTAFVTEAENVQTTYTLFCKAAESLTETVATANQKKTDFYHDETDNTLTATIAYAGRILHESFSQDSIESANYALKDTLSMTERYHSTALSQMKKAISTARRMHMVYYGSQQTESEILTACTEAEALYTSKYITGLRQMTIRLDGCYAEAIATCQAKTDLLQPLIDKAEVLNKLNPAEQLDDAIANAINACYSQDGRIAAIEQQYATLQALYAEYQAAYEAACQTLRTALSEAETLPEEQRTEALAQAIVKAGQLLQHTDVTDETSSAYADLTECARTLSEEMEQIKEALATALATALSDLDHAIAEARRLHNFYYGAAIASSEILNAVAEAEPLRTSTDTQRIQEMTQKVTESSTPATVRCSALEADIDNLVRRSSPLATLMEDAQYAAMLPVATECRNRQEGRITAMDSICSPLKETYEANSLKYDQATADLSDSLTVARDVYSLRADVALGNAIQQAQAALDAADKTSAASTKYSELKMHTATVAREAERIRILLWEETAIRAISVEGRKADLYDTRGHLVRQVDPTNPDDLKGLPTGVYLLNGQKLFIK